MITLLNYYIEIDDEYIVIISMEIVYLILLNLNEIFYFNTLFILIMFLSLISYVEAPCHDIYNLSNLLSIDCLCKNIDCIVLSYY